MDEISSDSIFSMSQFLPQGHCYLWRPEIVWTEVVSDFFIFFAFIVIAGTLFCCFRKGMRTSQRWAVIMFGLFIATCGFAHLSNIVTVWYPIYGLQSAIKAITAAISVATAVLFIPLVPRTVKLLKETNEKNGKSSSD